MGVLRNQARRLLAVPFVLDGVAALRDPAPRAKEFAPAVHRLAERYPRLPDDPGLLVRLQGAAGVVGGLLLLAGRAPRTACALLAAQSVPTVLAGLRGATGGDPEDRARRRAAAVKDLSLFGALVLAATEPRKRPSHLRWEAEHAVGRIRRSTARAGRRVRGRAGTAVSALGR
ncbi:DoxX family membrane protein [Actinorugispora endophytica]|uniref:Putative membrane protein YphA (DoxX/SURF4 family) n=1 Tax=Actinorugispora endophytica TaxID=1605990 RepID=A0A4R6V3E6_9ACTN|nr:DoxX family membrane protein [Actinorugispora endophytica]TDQ54693.1 putative membrane protein YphA (DoxX/SURF4 family) [Actinorugispora endophytica]